jgi:hypothetical protein
MYICEKEILLDAGVAKGMTAESRGGITEVILTDETEEVGGTDG